MSSNKCFYAWCLTYLYWVLVLGKRSFATYVKDIV